MDEHAPFAFPGPSTSRGSRQDNVDHVSSDRRPAPPPLEANAPLVTWAGIAGWVIALIVLLVVREHIPPSDRWWIWTCVTGIGLGVFALLYIPHLMRSRERAARRRAQEGQAGPGGSEPGQAR
jgi:NhaP-type Na+/H+ or K+/H+ antiporter